MNNVTSGIDFNSYAIKLSEGCHSSPKQGLCVMECVAYINGEKHSDHPECADTLVSSVAIQVNDSATDEQRNTLIKYVLRIAGSKDDSKRSVRAYYFLNRVYKAYIPAALRNINKVCLAKAFESLPDIHDNSTLSFVSKEAERLRSVLGTENSRLYCLIRGSILRSNFIATAISENISCNAGVLISTATHLIPSDEFFKLNCETLDGLLSFTEEKSDNDIDQKLKELSNVTNKELVVA